MPNRHHFTQTIAEIRALAQQGTIRPAPENRAEIKNRPRGTCEGYWNSLRMGVNAGQMLGYSMADSDVFARAVNSKDFTGCTLCVTDFGHRFAWLTRDPTQIVFADGHTLATLSGSDPQRYNSLMNTKISVSMSTDDDKEFLIDFIKQEYLLVNTTATALEGGELARGLPENTTREEAEAAGNALIAIHYPATPTARDSRLLSQTALVNAVAKGSDCFHTKVTGDNDLLAVAKEQLAPEESKTALATLSAWQEAEAELKLSLQSDPPSEILRAEEEVENLKSEMSTATKANKKEVTVRLKSAEAHLKQLKKAYDKNRVLSKKLLDARSFDHRRVGPLLYGFRDAVVADQKRGDGLQTETLAAKSVFHRWMKMSLASKSAWTANCKDVFSRYGEGNSPRYFNEVRFKAGWTRMQTMLA